MIILNCLIISLFQVIEQNSSIHIYSSRISKSNWYHQQVIILIESTPNNALIIPTNLETRESKSVEQSITVSICLQLHFPQYHESKRVDNNHYWRTNEMIHITVPIRQLDNDLLEDSVNHHLIFIDSLAIKWHLRKHILSRQNSNWYEFINDR